jgi:hypothetical protein
MNRGGRKPDKTAGFWCTSQKPAVLFLGEQGRTSMGRDAIVVSEELNALVMRPRSVQRCYEAVHCGGSQNVVKGDLEVTTQPGEAAAGEGR